MTKIVFHFLEEDRTVNLNATHDSKSLKQLDTVIKIEGTGSFRVRLTNFKDMRSDTSDINRMRAFKVINLTKFNHTTNPFGDNKTIRPRRGRIS